MELHIYTSVKLGSFVWGKQEENLFVLSENVHFSQQQQQQQQQQGKWRHHETVAFSLWVGWENGGLSYTWKEIIRSHFNEETPRSGKIFFVSISFLWFLFSSPTFPSHNSYFFIFVSVMRSSTLYFVVILMKSPEICSSGRKEIREMDWKRLPIFRLFFPVSSFESSLYTELCWMTHWPEI